jgi:hypothetical protein
MERSQRSRLPCLRPWRTVDEFSKSGSLGTSDDPVPFLDYWNAVDEALKTLFGIDTMDAGSEPDRIASAQEEGQTPGDFALWFGGKYGLKLISEGKAEWGRQ